VWGAIRIGGGDTTGGPPGVVLRLVTGRQSWPGLPSTLALAGEVVVLLVAAGGITWGWRHTGGSRSRVDAAAAGMGRGPGIEALRPEASRAGARRLIGRQATDDPATHGPLIGLSVAGRTPLRASWEDTAVVIAGPRTMKTSTQVIPDALDAPGAVVITSNKRDVADALRGPRSANGDQVWVFDPQDIAGQDPSWWWDPLARVRSVTQARRLAAHFAAGSRVVGAQRDAFFDSTGEDLLANLLLAAAVATRLPTQDTRPADGRGGQMGDGGHVREGGRPPSILAVYSWLTDSINRTPVDLLRHGGHTLSAQAVTGIIESPEKLRGSVYATARQMAGCLIEPSVTAWVTPPADPHAPQLRTEEFVQSRQTLIALSREGEGSAAPLVTALIAAVLEAGEAVAARSPGGRLPRPMIAALDEAANVCRIRNLPDLYSHYGSRGIILKTILQSWSQGEDVWGRGGMEKLWGSANIKIYGGGGADTAFLERLSKLIGERDVAHWSSTWAQGKRSVQHSTQRLRVLDVAELGALPKGRAVVIASGMVPTLVIPQPWWQGPHATAVAASLAIHDPGHTLPGQISPGQGRSLRPDGATRKTNG